MNDGRACDECACFAWVENGERIWPACTRDGGLVMLSGQSPELCDGFRGAGE